MRILKCTDAASVAAAIDCGARLDYVYMYPPRQAYRPLQNEEAEALVATSLRAAGRLNLYIHVPFCQQICAYCNLYAVASRGESHASYIDAVCRELSARRELVSAPEIRTLYVGGGTPSMLDPELLARLLRHMEDAFGFDLAGVPEVALEVSPDTATPARLAALRDAGFNRINLGVQTADETELAAIGRRYAADTSANALAAAMEAGFANVCVDLIFGLANQSLATWTDSVRFVQSYRPETICAYALTLRPGTGFAKAGYERVPDDQLRKWDVANHLLTSAGYERQTHVRWALPGKGGYLQKQYHWASEPLLGVGAGARSYLAEADVRNGYSLRRRRDALSAYMVATSEGTSPVTDGFVMDDDERARKAVVLGLQDLDVQAFEARFGADPRQMFATELGTLADLKLIQEDGGHVRLTQRGMRHRDVAVQPFFSERVRALVADFAYEE